MKPKTVYRVAIDARPLSSNPNGYTTYLVSIIMPLVSRGWSVTLLSNRPLDPQYDLARYCDIQVFGPAVNWRWEQLAVPHYLEEHPHEVYFAGANLGIPWRKVAGTRYILGFLDVIQYKFWRSYLPLGRFYFLRHELLRQLLSLWRADEIITISQHSAGDIKHYFGRQATPLLIKLPKVTGRKDIKPKPQFVYYGAYNPRKRVDNLLRAFASFREDHQGYKLILIGGGYEPYRRLIEQLQLGKSVVFPGYVSEAAKLTTIRESAALVYPSLYEGYGLAIAEAIQAGVPVISGVGGSQQEIGGSAALYIDPQDPQDIARALAAILTPTVRKQLEVGRTKQLPKISGPQVERAIIDYFTTQAESARGQHD